MRMSQNLRSLKNKQNDNNAMNMNMNHGGFSNNNNNHNQNRFDNQSFNPRQQNNDNFGRQQNQNSFNSNNNNRMNNNNNRFNSGNRNGNGNGNGFGNGGGFNNGGFNDNDDGEEIEAPPPSSAADLIAMLEQEQGAFVDTQTMERVECHQCGRKFAQTALQRHIKICKKVFGQKRKQFNVQRADDEALKAQRNTDHGKVNQELKRQKEKAKSKWKAQSSMLREAIKASKAIDKAIKEGKPLSEIPNMASQVPDDRVPCPHCGRKFAEETAKRHIPKCQNIKSRPTALKRRR